MQAIGVNRLVQSLMESNQIKRECFGKIKVCALEIGSDDRVNVNRQVHVRATFAKMGIDWEVTRFPDTMTRNEILVKISALNCDNNVHGIVILKPVHSETPLSVLQQALHPWKDIEGMHPLNIGKVVYGRNEANNIWPVTAKSAIEVLRQAFDGKPDAFRGAEVLVVGNSDVLAKPITSILHAEGATATVCQPTVFNFAAYARSAEIVVSAVSNGQQFLKRDMLRPGAIVVDLGVNYSVTNKFLGGDVDMASCASTISQFTSLTHGIGIVRSNILTSNLFHAMDKMSIAA